MRESTHPNNLDVPGVSARLITEMNKVVAGYNDFKRTLIATLLCGQHVLTHGFPDQELMCLVEALRCSIRGTSCGQLFLTDSTEPIDAICIESFDPRLGRVKPGPRPAVNNFLVAHDLANAPAAVATALLMALKYRTVRVSGREILIPDPFLVLAGCNRLHCRSDPVQPPRFERAHSTVRPRANP